MSTWRTLRPSPSGLAAAAVPLSSKVLARVRKDPARQEANSSSNSTSSSNSSQRLLGLNFLKGSGQLGQTLVRGSFCGAVGTALGPLQ